MGGGTNRDGSVVTRLHPKGEAWRRLRLFPALIVLSQLVQLLMVF